MTWPAPRRLPWLLLISAAIFAADRLAKVWVVAQIPMGSAIPIADHLLRLTHVANYGGNFGIFAEFARHSPLYRFVLVALNSLVMIAIFTAMAYLGSRLTRVSIGLALVLGGGLGCLHDRIAYGAVVDFIEVHIFHYHWPDFNVADIATLSGVCLIVSDLLLSKTRMTQSRMRETTA